MSQKTILVIDDSATIRRLVDGHLGTAGYTVVLAPTAEEGLSLADEIRPNLILLDHQLPGTTGYEVCSALAKNPELRQIPVVVSSTLRKRAYVEYADLPNVVDMLPKPYTTELLETTVANAIETGNMIVQSQAQGTAIPEVIETQTEASLAGSCNHFQLREVLDFLNNGTKMGVLEVIFSRYRVWVYLAEGRIQAVTATGIRPQELTATLPDSLRDLAPVFDMTLGAHRGNGADGLVQLLNNKVLDPRLLRKLLRHQASVLLLRCFHDKPGEFRFHACRESPALCQQLPLETSLVALLVEGCLVCDPAEIPHDSTQTVFARCTQRGQNLDRSGLAPYHMKVLSAINEGHSLSELSQQVGAEESLHRILHALVLAGLVRKEIRTQQKTVVVFNTDVESVRSLRDFFGAHAEELTGKIVRDPLAFKLLLKKQLPWAVLIRVADASHLQLLRELTPCGRVNPLEQDVPVWIALADSIWEGEAQDLVHVCLDPLPKEPELWRVLQRTAETTVCLTTRP